MYARTDNLPTECATGCILSWFWTPLLSGQCEIYHSCFDVVVPNSKGGIETSAYAYVPGSSPTCVRVDDTTHITPNYGPFGGGTGTGGGPVTTPPTDGPAPPSGGDGDGADEVQKYADDLKNGCVDYTVVAGDTLAKIGEGFDIEWAIVQEANKANYPSLNTDPDYIDVGWTLQIPQTECAFNGKTCADDSCNPEDSTGAAVGQASLSVAAAAAAAMTVLVL